MKTDDLMKMLVLEYPKGTRLEKLTENENDAEAENTIAALKELAVEKLIIVKKKGSAVEKIIPTLPLFLKQLEALKEEKYRIQVQQDAQIYALLNNIHDNARTFVAHEMRENRHSLQALKAIRKLQIEIRKDPESLPLIENALRQQEQ
jgi:hypothetical protein